MYYLHFIPIFSTILATAFAIALFLRYKERGKLHYLWWGIGFLTFAAGTFAESWNTVMGWSDANLRFWYIVGAFLGGYPLAQGSIYLLMNKKFAHWSAIIVCSYIVVASSFVVFTPVDKSLVDTIVVGDHEVYRLSGKALEWTWIRAFSPWINIYAVIFLVGGAAHSAWLSRKASDMRGIYIGNILIAIGGILPGIGGSMTRAGFVEILYITEFLGIIFIYTGYRFCIAVRNELSNNAKSKEGNQTPATA